MASKKTILILLVAAAAFIIVVGLLISPIAQPQAYHNFADQRSWLGVTNAWNVLSNILFALTGLWGLFLLLVPNRVSFVDNRERWFWVILSIGLLLTAIGSGYYHLSPDNPRLVWDRLPMVIVFMSFVAALIAERISVTLGLWLWPVLLAIGIYSVLFWQESELHGKGDLRFYGGVQAFVILTACIMLLAPASYTRTIDLGVVVILFILSKVFEFFDVQIYALSRGFISGHSLKHLAAAAAALWLIRMLAKRKIIKGESVDPKF